MRPTASKVEPILARFPGPVTLYPSRKKWLLILLISAMFTAGGFWMVAERAPKGWYVLIFFAACLIVAVVMLLPGAGDLVLDRDGFQITSLFRSHRVRWQNAKGFEPISIPYSNQRMVGFDDAAAGRTLAALNTAIAGHNAALPDTYGFSVDELAQLMARWQERAVTA
jgi:hypothetical protein